MAKKTFQEVQIDRVISKPQIRRIFDKDAIAGIMQTILMLGVLQPIAVRREGDHFVITDGELRWRTAKQAGLTAIPVMIEEQELSEADVMLRQLVSNCQRQDLTPLETAHAIAGLMEKTGWNASETATKLGKSNATITRSLSLLSLPESIQEQVETGVIAASAAYELARIDDPQKQAQFAGQVVEGHLTRDELAGKLKAARAASAISAKAPVSRVTAILCDGHSITMTGAELTLESFIASLEQLLAKARRARPQGLELGTFLKMLKDQAKS